MIKYKHKETGLFLTKRKHVYSSVYDLTEKGTIWQRDCLKTLSLTKLPSKFGHNQWFKPEEFETVKFKLVEEWLNKQQ